MAAENTLFDAKDTLLRTTDPKTLQEAGFMTTARDALGRLAMAGVTPEFAEDAARALSREVAMSFARGETARAVAGKLGAHELFDGAVYSASAQRYEGVWLDLRALSAELVLPSAPVVLQALHLASALAEVPPNTPLLLSTSATRRPSERTHYRMILEGTRWLLEALRRLGPNPRPSEAQHTTNDERVREVLLARVRERAAPDVAPALQRHLADLEAAIANGSAGPNALTGPLADGDLAALERQLAAGDIRGIERRIEQLERARGTSSGTRYLRLHTALVRGEEPQGVAAALTQLSTDEPRFHEASILAARAWLAGGDPVRARHHARVVVEDATASDGARLVGLEILESTTATSESLAPPPVVIIEPESVVAHVARPLARIPLYPTLGDELPAPQAVAVSIPVPATHAIQHSAAPLYATPAARSIARLGRARAYDPELVESLALPMGANESVLGVNELPTNALQARVAMTRLARDLARDYRLWYAKTLRCDIMAVESMQQHLTNRFAGAPIAEPAVAWELRRHGALLSGIAARALGGDWVDVGPTEPGYWAMHIPPSTRTWPIGRVYRFVSLGSRERDLVSYYLDLETRSREG